MGDPRICRFDRLIGWLKAERDEDARMAEYFRVRGYMEEWQDTLRDGRDKDWLIRTLGQMRAKTPRPTEAREWLV